MNVADRISPWQRKMDVVMSKINSGRVQQVFVPIKLETVFVYIHWLSTWKYHAFNILSFGSFIADLYTFNFPHWVASFKHERNILGWDETRIKSEKKMRQKCSEFPENFYANHGQTFFIVPMDH